jgi:hypothetical protein
LAAAWRLGEPGFHHTIEVGAVGLWVLAVHPLPVQTDAKLVHVHGGLQTRYLRRLMMRWPDCPRSLLAEARNDVPERPLGALDVTGHVAPRPLAQVLVRSQLPCPFYSSHALRCWVHDLTLQTACGA